MGGNHAIYVWCAVSTQPESPGPSENTAVAWFHPETTAWVQAHPLRMMGTSWNMMDKFCRIRCNDGKISYHATSPFELNS